MFLFYNKNSISDVSHTFIFFTPTIRHPLNSSLKVPSLKRYQQSMSKRVFNALKNISWNLLVGFKVLYRCEFSTDLNVLRCFGKLESSSFHFFHELSRCYKFGKVVVGIPDILFTNIRKCSNNTDNSLN